MKTHALLLILFLMGCLFAAQAQNQLISGTVTDAATKQALPGVTVIIKGTSTGTATDPKGKYTLTVSTSEQTLVFSYIGYTTQEVKIGKKTRIDVAMASDQKALEEVVVVGYSTKRKLNLRGRAAGIAVTTPGFNYSVNAPQIIYPGNRYAGTNFNTEEYQGIQENIFLEPKNNPLSTFSIDVDAASYSNVRRFLTNGQVPPPDAVRIEEMVNYFHYDYPQPPANEPVSINTELSLCPWNKENRLLHIGLQGKSIAIGNLPASNLVFLIDVSGSMEAPDKLPLVKAGFKMLVEQLRPQDQVAIVVYAGAAGLVLPSTPGNQKSTILAAIDHLRAGGSTAGSQGILLAYEIAKTHFKNEGNNRVILATDGDFNVGVSSNGELERLIAEKRESNIFLTVLGFGTGNYKDAKMETLADKGNGNYAYVDNILEAKKVFVNEFGGTLFTIAKDVKLQLEFNPAQVKAYRLIGYENRALKNEDFNNDKKDAGDLGSGHIVTALYEIIPAPSKNNQNLTAVDDLKYQTTQVTVNAAQTNEVVTLKLRYKEPTGDKSKLLQKIVTDKITAPNATSENFRFAAAVAQFGLLLRNSEFKAQSSYTNVLELAQSARGKDEEGYRIEFINLVKSSKILQASAQNAQKQD